MMEEERKGDYSNGIKGVVYLKLRHLEGFAFGLQVLRVCKLTGNSKRLPRGPLNSWKAGRRYRDHRTSTTKARERAHHRYQEDGFCDFNKNKKKPRHLQKNIP